MILFTWWVTRGQLPARAGSFLLVTGLIAGLLAIDDQFMVHEYLATRGPGGRGERWVLLAYFALGLTYVAWFRPIVFHRENRLILVAGALLAVSVLVDQVQVAVESVIGPDWRIFIEDGVKLLGIAIWTAALVLHSVRAIERWRAQPG